MDIFLRIDTILIKVYCGIDMLSGLICKCMTPIEAMAREITLSPQYFIYISENKGLDSVSLVCHTDTKNTIYGDNIPKSYCLPVLFNQVFPLIVMREKMYLLFHASGIIHRDRLILFVGSSGSGKTTLTLKALFKHGAYYFSDDLTIYNVLTKKFVPCMHMFHIKPGTEKYFLLDGNEKTVFQKNKAEGNDMTYKIFCPEEFPVPVRVYDKSFIPGKIIIINACFHEYCRFAMQECVEITAPDVKFRTMINNCMNIKSSKKEFIEGYSQIKEHAIFFNARYWNDDFLDKIILEL